MWSWAIFTGLNSVWGLAAYVWFALCLHTIANKTGAPNGWLAWLPIANLYLMCQVAGRSGWWTVLFFIPLLNLIIAIIVWVGIAEARGKPAWLGILMIIPVINLIVPGILAFSES